MKPACVFLIEDNPGDVRLVQEALRGMAHVEAAANGTEALHYIFNDGLRPDLVLLDLNLPGLDGLSVLRTIKADTRTRHIPVAVFSSSAAQNDVQRAYAMEATCYITKPLHLHQFMRTLRSVSQFLLEATASPDQPNNHQRGIA